MKREIIELLVLDEYLDLLAQCPALNEEKLVYLYQIDTLEIYLFDELSIDHKLFYHSSGILFGKKHA